jgi:large subunit ribosomal protein L4
MISMLSAALYDKEGKQKETCQLDERLFGQKINLPVLHQYIKAYLANQRQGTAKKKNRVEVSGGGAKPWRQKGTGRARSGSNTSPVWVGGGRAFPPEPRDYRMAIPKKIKRQALLSALTAAASEGRIKIIEDVTLEAPKTKVIAELIGKLGIDGTKVLFLTEGKDDHLQKSCRNLNGLVYKRACLVNPYDLLICDFVLITNKALDSLTEAFAR